MACRIKVRQSCWVRGVLFETAVTAQYSCDSVVTRLAGEILHYGMNQNITILLQNLPRQPMALHLLCSPSRSASRLLDVLRISHGLY